MQNLGTNWLVISKLTWGICHILIRTTRESHNFYSNGILFEQIIYWLLYKSAEESSFMARKIDGQYGEELTCHFKIDMRNLSNFDLEHSRVSKFFTLKVSFWAKYILFDLQKYRGVIHSKVSKMCTLMGSFWAKYIMFELKSTRELCLIAPKIDTKYKRKLCTDLYFQKWQSGKFSWAEK